MRLNVHEWGDAAAPPVVCLHGVSAHGRRFRKLAEERLARHFRVLAPDLRGHGRSGYEPPWSISTQLDDVVETIRAEGVERAAWVGHSYGGRLVLHLAEQSPELISAAVLLDPAIQILPHVGLDFAQGAAKERVFASADEAIEARLESSHTPTPRAFLEEEAEEHLETMRDGGLHWRYCRAAVVTAYGELCTEPPPPTVLQMPALLVHASEFGLVLEEQLDEYTRVLGEHLEVTSVPGGHIVYWDAYEETADVVEEFLLRHRDVSHA